MSQEKSVPGRILAMTRDEEKILSKKGRSPCDPDLHLIILCIYYKYYKDDILSFILETLAGPSKYCVMYKFCIIIPTSYWRNL